MALSIFNFENEKEFISFDLPTKKNCIVKMQGTTEDPYFCGKDLCAILEFKDWKKTLQIHVDDDDKKSLSQLQEERKTNPDLNYFGKNYEKLSYNDGKAVYVNSKGLKSLLQRSRKAKPSTAKAILENLKSQTGIDLKLDLIMPSKEQRTIDCILRSFPTVASERQFRIGDYSLDLYFPKFKIAVECDEFGHRNRDPEYESDREEFAREILGCEFVRFDPDAVDFDIFSVIGEISALMLAQK